MMRPCLKLKMASDVDYWYNTCLGHIKSARTIRKENEVLKKNQNTK